MTHQKSNKKRFLYWVFACMAWDATVRRSNFYKKDASEDSRKALRNFAKCKVQEIGQQIQGKASRGKIVMSDDAYIRRVEDLKNAVDNCPHIAALPRKNFKFGRAQKFLNLYLKYMWCADEISMPPHCPFDNEVLNELGVGCSCGTSKSWTNCNSIKCYKAWLKAIRNRIQNEGKKVSIAEWECEFFSGAED